MTSKTTTTRKATTTTSKAKAKPADVLAGIRDRNRTDAFDIAGSVTGIMAAERAATTATATLGERLADAPRIAAEVHGIRGAQARIASQVSGAKNGPEKNAAEQAIGRIVKCGRVLAAHPTLDPLAVYAATNRMTTEQVDEVVAAKDGATAIAKASKDAKAKAGAKGGKAKGPKAPKVRTLREQVIAASKENASALKKAKDLVGEDPATVATDLTTLIDSLTATLKAATVMRDGAKAEAGRRAAK